MGKSLAQTTADRLLELINKRNYKVGDKIPNEFALAEDLNVGRSTLREAVKCLVTRNILEVRQGSGTFISDKKGVVEDPLGLSFVDDTDKLLKDLFEFRTLIEPRIAELVAIKASDEEIVILENLVNKIEELIMKDDPKHLELDIKLHSLMAKMSGNIAFHNIIPTITKSIMIINQGYSTEDMRMTTVKLHRLILNFIKDRDPIGAREAMMMHITLVKMAAREKNNN